MIALSGFSAASRAEEVVNVVQSGTSSDVIVYLAQERGYFHEQGLFVKLTPINIGIAMIAPLGTGQLDAATSSANAALYNAVARGIEVKIVASSGNAPPSYGHNILLVRKALIDGGGYKKPQDIKGMSIGMPSPGSSATATLNAYLTKIGLKFSDIRPIYLSYPDQVVALSTGKLDAALTAEPQASQAIAAKSAVRVTSDDIMDPYHEAAVFLMSGKFIHGRPDAARKFMVAFLKAARFYNGALSGGYLKGPNAPAVISALTKYTPIKDAEVYRSISPQGVDPNGKLNVKGLQKDLDFYRTQGWISGQVAAQDAVDQSLMAAAQQTLGPYAPTH